jgi:glycine cleavage system H protein
VSDVYAPVAGEVIDTNASLSAQSELINTDPYGKGYLLKIRVSNPAEIEGLLSAGDYKPE